MPLPGRQKARAQKAERVPFEHDLAKKGKVKGQRSRSPVYRDKSARRQHAKKKGESPSGKEDRLPCSS